MADLNATEPSDVLNPPTVASFQYQRRRHQGRTEYALQTARSIFVIFMCNLDDWVARRYVAILFF